MNNSDTNNLIKIMRSLNWTGEQINDLQLGIGGGISLEEAIEKLQDLKQPVEKK